jgi:phosphohistidine phosphatase
MTLYLLRHGAAVEWKPGMHDADRPLTPRGVRRMRRVAVGMAAIGLRVDHILSSPCVRAHQTAQIVVGTLPDSPPVRICPHLAHAGSATELIEAIGQLPSPATRVLLVGHEPDLGQLISTLLVGRPSMTADLSKAGLCCLRIDELRFGKCAALKWFLTGRLLRALAHKG